METRHDFGSKLGAVLASAGSAVGLGNVWRFPTEVGNNGGAVFIFIYLICIAVIGIPVMMSEFLIGRHTHTNTISAFAKLAPGKWWRIEGVAGVFVAFLILSYYIVISGWTLFYLIESVCGQLQADRNYSEVFTGFVSNPWMPILAGVALCFLFRGDYVAVLLLGVFLMNCTMPVTLYLANEVLKQREGLAFGLLAAALIPGWWLAVYG